ncbi:MAG: hypothetical protein ABIE94_01130 [archaeon]
MSEHIHIPTFDEIRKVLEGTEWEHIEPLPAWLARHGKISGDDYSYSEVHFFTGYAKLLNREFHPGIDYLWNEQLIPWDWYVGISQLPEDPQILVGLEQDTELQSQYVWLQYADEYGVWSGRFPEARRRELTDRFFEITRKLVAPTPQKPNIVQPHGDLTAEDLVTIYSEDQGVMLTSILPQTPS